MFYIPNKVLHVPTKQSISESYLYYDDTLTFDSFIKFFKNYVKNDYGKFTEYPVIYNHHNDNQIVTLTPDIIELMEENGEYDINFEYPMVNIEIVNDKNRLYFQLTFTKKWNYFYKETPISVNEHQFKEFILNNKDLIYRMEGQELNWIF